MKSKLVARKAGERTFVLILDPGEEAFANHQPLRRRGGLSAASLTALGAVREGHGRLVRPQAEDRIARSRSSSNARR